MKPRVTNFFLISCLLILPSCRAQLTITLENSQKQQLPEAEILSADFMTGEITHWGSIDANGNTSFTLEYNYMKQMLTEAEKQQKNAPQGWTLSFHTVGSTYECTSYSNKNTITIQNTDAKMFPLPAFYVGEAATKTNFGRMFIGSNSNVASWLYSNQIENAARGFYLDWVYVEKDSSVKGTCSVLTMTGHEDEEVIISTNYKLNFNEGWNIVVYTIDEVFNSGSGRVFPTNMTVSTSDFIPEGSQVFLMKDN